VGPARPAELYNLKQAFTAAVWSAVCSLTWVPELLDPLTKILWLPLVLRRFSAFCFFREKIAMNFPPDQ